VRGDLEPLRVDHRRHHQSARGQATEIAVPLDERHPLAESPRGDADPELFFPDGDIPSARTQVKTAKLICRGCPVSATCLNWALASGQEAGIWGGLTEGERHRLSRRGPFSTGHRLTMRRAS
jgi:WhiB family transcriptional regulator, redox-sensing transcriptional regulator